ncbi:Unknown protein sequence [Pseudomonas syringae pv. maculicola]|nr:Unknown protein sequence [Pseudomonas syringae pv. maculicola]
MTDEIAEALIGMDLAEQIETVAPAKEKPTTVKKDKAT